MEKKEPIPSERIAKVIARSGVCSRRSAESYIAEGRVSVNGTVLTTPAFKVSEQDLICIDGQAINSKEPTRLWCFYKPKSCITSHHDPEGRTMVFELLPSNLPRVISVGRLDYNTEGLLLLTNDGALARHLELPRTGLKRSYRVRAHGHITPQLIQKLQSPLVIDGIRYAPMEASIDSKKGNNSWLTLTLTEGKNREIRKVLSHFNIEVTRLIRTDYGPFHLADMDEGDLIEVPASIIKKYFHY